ncbi:MAG: translocation/assembly module TamB domain-containing protein [Desulfobacterales bacterium]|nr:translocation/assembly module TamB domain-containing protein [Desulfobacterales bacterium]
MNTSHCKNFILAELNKRIHGTLNIGYHHISIWKGTLEIHNVQLQDDSGKDISNFKRFFIDVSVAGLAFKIIQIESIELENPNLFIETVDNGQLNIIKPFIQHSWSEPKITQKEPKSTDITQLHIAIDKLNISDGNIKLKFNDVDSNFNGIHIDAQATILNQSGNLQVKIEHGNFKNNHIHTVLQRFFATAKLSQGSITDISVLADSDLGKLDISGSITNIFQHPYLDIKNKNRVNLAFLNAIVNKEFSGEVSTDITAKGLIQNPDLSMLLEYNGGLLAGNQVDEIKCILSMSKLIVTLNHFSLTRKDANIFVNGTADINNAFKPNGLLSKKPDIQQIACDLDLNVMVSSLSSLLSGFGIRSVKGNAELKTHVIGTLKEPVVESHVKTKQLAVNNISIGDVVLKANLNRLKELDIRELSVYNKRSSITINGIIKPFTDSFQLIDDPAFQLTVTSKKLFIDDFVELIKGKVSLSANLDGSIKHPSGKIKMNAESFDINGKQKIKSIALSAIFEKEKITLNPLTIFIKHNELIQCTGWVALNKNYHFTLTSTPISLKSIDGLHDLKDIEGNISLNFFGASTIDNPKLNGQVGLRGLKLKNKTLNDISLELYLADYIVKVNGESDFKLNGLFDIKQKDFNASILFKETLLNHYFTIAGMKDLKGKINGYLTVKGNINELDKMNAALRLSDITIFFKDHELVSSTNLNVNYSNKELSTPGIMLMLLKECKMQVSGKGRIDGDAKFSFNGKIPLGIAKAFTEEVPDITGYVLLNGNINGNLTKPSITTYLVLEKIGMTLPVINQKLHSVSGKINLTQDLICIENISGGLDSGKFTIYGNIELENFMPSQVQLNVKAHSMPITIPDTLNLLLNADMNLRGTHLNSSVQGDIVLLEGNYYKDINIDLLKIATERKREYTPLSSEISSPFLNHLQLDISVKSRGQFTVTNNIADLSIHPDIKVNGKMVNPIISGRVNIDSGTIIYQKKTFEVKKGIIDFINPYKIEPTIDIKSETEIRDWLIFLEISGNPDALSFKLSSIPQEDDASIISLLLFGKTLKEIAKSGSQSSKSTEQIAAEIFVSRFGDDIKKKTGIDTLQLETKSSDSSTTNASALDGMKITIGKQLSKRMSIKYSVESKNGEMLQTTSSEYKLLEHILLNGFQDTKGIFGGKIIFRLEFR